MYFNGYRRSDSAAILSSVIGWIGIHGRLTAVLFDIGVVVTGGFARGGLEASGLQVVKVLCGGPQAVSKDRKDETLRRQQEGQREMLRLRASAASKTPLQKVIERTGQWGTGDAQPGRRD